MAAAKNIKPKSIIKLVVSIVVIAFAWSIRERVKGIFRKMKLKADLADRADTTNVVTESGAKEVSYVAIAEEVYAAFYESDLFGWTEDEERAIEAIKPLSKDQVKKVAEKYRRMYEKDLYKDYLKYLDKKDYERLREILE